MLVATYFETNTSNVWASCSGICSTITGLFAAVDVLCPGIAGKTCVYYVHLEANVADPPGGNNGEFLFLVDGAAPNPGPTNGDGSYSWIYNDPLDGGALNARSYAVTATVTNGTANQSHSIEVDVGCAALHGNGCSIDAGLANLAIAVYTPYAGTP